MRSLHINIKAFIGANKAKTKLLQLLQKISPPCKSTPRSAVVHKILDDIKLEPDLSSKSKTKTIHYTSDLKERFDERGRGARK